MFDVYIQKMAEYIEGMRAKGRQIRVFNSHASAIKLKAGLPIRVGPQANPGVILREDTLVELGNPEVGSCAFILRTDNPSLIRDGKITLIGPGIEESAGESLPFGQVLMVGGRELDDREHEALQHIQFIGDQIEGYMVRSLSQNLWSRVSKDAARKGFCFEALGRALMAIYKSNNLKIETMEIIFVTSSKDDVKLLDNIAAQVHKISREIVKENWKIRGYDIDCIFDCSSCVDKAVCDDIRKVLKASNKNEKN